MSPLDMFSHPFSFVENLFTAFFNTVMRLLGFNGGNPAVAGGGDPIVPFGFNSTLPGTGAMC